MPVIGGAAPMPRAFMPVVTPPVSGVSYQNNSGSNLLCSLTCTVNPTVLAASSVKVEVSVDGTTWTQYGLVAIPAGGISLAGSTEQVFMQVPYQWWYRVTATNASIGSLVAIG